MSKPTVNTGVPHVILLRGDPIRGESPAVPATIKPGMLLERTSADKVQQHSTAGGKPTAAIFADVNTLTGKSIDDAYAADDNVQFLHCKPGDWVYAWLEIGGNVAIGEMLQSNGAGALETSGYDGEAVAQALQAVNNTSGAIARIKVEVL